MSRSGNDEFGIDDVVNVGHCSVDNPFGFNEA